MTMFRKSKTFRLPRKWVIVLWIKGYDKEGVKWYPTLKSYSIAFGYNPTSKDGGIRIAFGRFRASFSFTKKEDPVMYGK